MPNEKMRYRHTRHQVPRGTLPDAETRDRIVLIKNVSVLRATYQVLLLALKAEQTGKKLALRVPKACKLAPGLLALRHEQPNLISVERV